MKNGFPVPRSGAGFSGFELFTTKAVLLSDVWLNNTAWKCEFWCMNKTLICSSFIMWEAMLWNHNNDASETSTEAPQVSFWMPLCSAGWCFCHISPRLLSYPTRLQSSGSDGWAWIFSSNRLNEVQRQKGCTPVAVWYLSNREQPLLISKHLYIISAELCAEQKDLHHSIRHVNSIQFFMEAATGFGWPFRKPPLTVDDPHWGCVSSLHEY